METIFYGNGPIVANILTSIVYILNSSDYHTLLVLMMTLAGALMIGQWHMVNSGGGSGTHGLFVAIGTVVVLYYGGWQPKETLVIYDPLNNFQTAVTDVPEAFAQVVHISNKITNGFADLFDQGFHLSGFPTSMNYSNGMGNGLMAIEALGQLQPSDQFLTMNISNYFKDCVFPAMLMNNGSGPSVNDIAQSTNLLQTIQTNLSNAWVTNYYSQSNPGGATVTCTQMYTNLSTDITNAINNPNGSIVKAYTNQMIMGMAGAATYANPSTNIDLLQTSLNYIISGSVASQDILAHAVLINSFNPALQSFAAQNGLNPNALNNALTQNILETTTTMNTSYALAQQILPLAFAIMSALIYAILPIVFAMMFIPQLTKKFGLMAFSLLMWIAFWAPLASVVNALVQASAAQTYNVMGVSSITPQNWGYLMGHTYTLMAIAGDIMFSVPVLAFALASGSSYAMTAVAGSVAGLSKAAAARAASSMADMGGAQREQAEASQFKQLDLAAKANNMPTDLAAQRLVEAQASNPAASLATFNAIGFNKMMQGNIGNQAFQFGVGESLAGAAGAAGATNANTLGGKQGERTKGGIQGAWDAYVNSGAAQSGMSFSQWAATQSEYNETGVVSKAQQMEQLAHQYFGDGNDALYKMMNFENAIASRQQLGGYMGLNEAYKEAKKNGFKGDLTQFQEFQEKIHQESLFGQNLATVNAANLTSNGNVIAMTEEQRTWSNVESTAKSRAIRAAVKQLGLPTFMQDYLIGQFAQMGGWHGYGSSDGAYRTRAWGSGVESATAGILSNLFGSPQNYANFQQAANVMSTYSQQMDTAVASNDKNLTNSMNDKMAQYLQQFGPTGAIYETSNFVNASDKILKMTAKNALSTEEGRKQMAKLVANAQISTPELLKKFGINISAGAGMEHQIDAVLKSSKGIDFAADVLRMGVTNVAYKMATHDPSHAFADQKAFIGEVMRAGQTGNWKELGSLLNNNFNTQEQIRQTFYNNSTPGHQAKEMAKDTIKTVEAQTDQVKKVLNPGGADKIPNIISGGNDNSPLAKTIRNAVNSSSNSPNIFAGDSKSFYQPKHQAPQPISPHSNKTNDIHF